MSEFNFKIESSDKNSKARAGKIFTKHGVINTPSFVPVGTQATIKSLSNLDLKEIGVQIFFINTYHIYLRPGLEVIKHFNGLHEFTSWNGPLITDSAGFQIFSLGEGRRLKVLEDEPKLVKISDKGVVFRSHLDGSEHYFTPEKSIEAQGILGADITLAFDECTYYPATHDYAQKAMERTHSWALRCLAVAGKELKDYQALYGVVQGSIFEDLRKESARFIGALPFQGFAIGGVAVGESKEEMKDVLKWVIPNLPENKPRHLLGVGEIDDIFDLVENGIDTFDCVMPSRLGRMGHTLVHSSKFIVHSSKWTIDITKAEYAKDKRPIDENCNCLVCKNYSRGYINHLFRAKELLSYRLATYHNIYFINELLRKIRLSISEGKFLSFRRQFLNEK